MASDGGFAGTDRLTVPDKANDSPQAAIYVQMRNGGWLESLAWAYPYTAGMTDLSSPIFNEGCQGLQGESASATIDSVPLA